MKSDGMGRKTSLKNISAFINKTKKSPTPATQAGNGRVGLVHLLSTHSLLACEEDKR